MFYQIIKNINFFIDLNPKEEEAFIKILEIKHFKKKQLLLESGNLCDKILFINKGCVRSFFVVDGVENTFQFFFDNSWYTDYESFLKNEPTLVNLQALEDCEVVEFKKSDLYKIYEQYPIFEKLGRIMAERAYLSATKLYRMFYNEEPEERYLNLLEQHPEIVERIPQHYIASYLGLQPQSLSRIRGRIFNKK